MARRDYVNSRLTASQQRQPKTRTGRWLARLTTLQLALLVSVSLHVVLLTVRFVDPERFNRMFQDTPLEVILVNARSDEVPLQAQAIAQANLAGGGEAATGRATSPLPPAATVELGETTEESRRQIKELQEQQQQLLAQIRREVALLPPPDPARDTGTPEERAQEEKRRQLLRFLAEIEKRISEENARPKKRYVSPSTLEGSEAIWYDAFKRRVEDRGTRDFPEYQGKKLYGELTLNITIDAKGRVVEIDVVKPSSSRLLDRRAMAIARAASPYGAFTPEMKKRWDQFVVTSRFRFTKDVGLEATAETSARP